ncbi:hypothetical protein [Devosia sp. SL43]|uniref:hypothetical protein n=1 Tax=Devosia sp. SL43 TaxID=2806348 RepID=UPI001F360AAB|nr:hypothetical protein [Devosia sp. SL43]UJW86324.1 hypothetical protein IM737_03350 [Devosia sp. SL43]
MRLISATSILLLATAPAFADCDAYGDIRAPDFAPEAATVSELSTLVILDSGMALSSGDRVIVTSQLDDQFSCVVRPGSTSGYQPDSGMVLTTLLEPDNQRGDDWLGEWQGNPEQFLTIEQAEDILDISGNATWGMSDPERVESGGINVGEFVASARPKKGRIAFTLDYAEGQTLPYDPESDSCSVRLWLAGEFLVASDNDRCGGMNVTFTGYYSRKSTD